MTCTHATLHNLSALFPAPTCPCFQNPRHIIPPLSYVIGVQECNYSAREGAQNCKEDWRNTLVRHMGRQYRLVSFHNLWEIRVAVFVRNRYRLSIGPVLYHMEATGIGNVLGNKGAVVLSLDFNHTSMCFVVCHLAAHQGEITRRNQSARSIFRNAKAWCESKIGITHPFLEQKRALLFHLAFHRTLLPTAPPLVAMDASVS